MPLAEKSRLAQRAGGRRLWRAYGSSSICHQRQQSSRQSQAQLFREWRPVDEEQ